MRHTRDELIVRAEREFELLDRAIAGLAPADWEQMPPRRAGEDPWTVKDALAHITARKQDFVAGIRGAPGSRGVVAVHAYNHNTFAEWHARPIAELLDLHRRTHEELLHALREAPESWFERDETAQWPAAIGGHSANHRKRDIERPLNQRSPQGKSA